MCLLSVTCLDIIHEEFNTWKLCGCCLIKQPTNCQQVVIQIFNSDWCTDQDDVTFNFKPVR